MCASGLVLLSCITQYLAPNFSDLYIYKLRTSGLEKCRELLPFMHNRKV